MTNGSRASNETGFSYANLWRQILSTKNSLERGSLKLDHMSYWQYIPNRNLIRVTFNITQGDIH